MDLSVIILNYNTRDILRRCLASVFASHTDFKFEVLVADNGSADGSQEMVKSQFPQAKLTENGKNVGFSKGNNAAIGQSSGRYVLLLNSDTEVRPNTLDLCVKRMEADKDIGILGCKVLLPDGSLDKACRRKFPNPWNSFLRLFGLRRFSNYNINSPVNQEVEIDAVTGAFLMIRREAMDKVGLLDEDYFMYGEDLDWCWQVKHTGFKVLYYPQAEITHYKYSSSQSIPFFIIRQAHDAMKIFYRKHYADKYPWVFNQLVYLGISIRMFCVLSMNLFRNKKTVH